MIAAADFHRWPRGCLMSLTRFGPSGSRRLLGAVECHSSIQLLDHYWTGRPRGVIEGADAIRRDVGHSRGERTGDGTDGFMVLVRQIGSQRAARRSSFHMF